MISKKRAILVFAVMLVAVSVLTLSVSAAGDTASISTFNLWDLLDGLGGFFRDLINAVGGFFSKLVTAIGNAVSYLLSGIKHLFIPSRESFSNFRDDILTKFDKKFGSVFSALNYLSNRFQGLRAKKDLYSIFTVVFPKSSFYSGISIDFLAYASPVLAFFRFCITGFVCYETAMTCYNRVISMSKT